MYIIFRETGVGGKELDDCVKYISEYVDKKLATPSPSTADLQKELFDLLFPIHYHHFDELEMSIDLEKAVPMIADFIRARQMSVQEKRRIAEEVIDGLAAFYWQELYTKGIQPHKIADMKEAYLNEKYPLPGEKTEKQ